MTKIEAVIDAYMKYINLNRKLYDFLQFLKIAQKFVKEASANGVDNQLIVVELFNALWNIEEPQNAVTAVSPVGSKSIIFTQGFTSNRAIEEQRRVFLNHVKDFVTANSIAGKKKTLSLN